MFSKGRLGAYFATILNEIALPRHLFALFNTVLMVLKIVTLLYNNNGHLCFFYGDCFEVINTTLMLCIPVILSIDHVS